jgi:hypothetical protein
MSMGCLSFALGAVTVVITLLSVLGIVLNVIVLFAVPDQFSLTGLIVSVAGAVLFGLATDRLAAIAVERE